MPDSASASRRLDRLEERASPFQPKLKAIAENILDKDGPSVIRVIEKMPLGARSIPIYFFARAEHVSAVLNDDKNFSLSHYDDLLAAAADPVRFILGANTSGRQERTKMVAAIVGHRKSEEYRLATARIKAIARENAQLVVAGLMRRYGEAPSFNVIREFGYLVPYLTSSRFLGIWGPSSPSLLVRTFMFFRNLSAPGRAVRFSPETTPGAVMLTWSHLVMGHVFANFENRDPLLLSVAQVAAKEMSARIDKQIAHQIPRYSDALLTRFCMERLPNIPPEKFNSHLRSILFEFAGSIIILVGIAFAKIFETLLRTQVSIGAFAREVDSEDGASVIDEALRLDSPTANLFRRVTHDVSVGGALLRPGDYACLLVHDACLDARSFPSPLERDSNPDRSRFLTFGPVGGPHACYGQFWAREILREMFIALADLPRLRPADPSARQVGTFLGLPDRFELQYDTINLRPKE